MKFLLILVFIISCKSQHYPELKEFTNKELFGQMVMLGIKNKSLSENEKRWLKDYAVGTVILLKRNVSTDVKDMSGTIKHYQSFAKKNRHQIPLLIAVDQENGWISRLQDLVTTLPNNYALGVLNNTELTQKVAEMSGKELLSMGIHWSLSPVADVNSNPKNPIIGVRSFGEKAKRVEKHVNAYIKGLNDANVLSSIKHFPGHGDTEFDSHYDKVIINRSFSELKSTELIPFSNLQSDQAASSLMISHIQFPKIDPENLPSTISETVHSWIPKSYMGLIVSDELEMNALSKFHNPYQSVVKMIELGTNVIIMARALKQRVKIDSMFQYIDDYAQQSPSFRLKLEKSVEKILNIKKKYKNHSPDIKRFRKLREEHSVLADSIFLSIPYQNGKKIPERFSFKFSNDAYTESIVKKHRLKDQKNGKMTIQFINKKNPPRNSNNVIISLENPYILNDVINPYRYCFYNRYAPVKKIFKSLFGMNK